MTAPAAVPVAERLVVLHPSGGQRAVALQAREPVPRVAMPPPDLQAVRAEAYREGHVSGRLEATVEFEQRIDAITASHRDERQRLVEERGAELAQRLEASVEAARISLAGAVAAVLRPFLERLVRAEALDVLVAELKEVVNLGTPAAVVVKANDDILASLGARLVEAGITARYESASGTEISVQLDQMLIETRIGEWLKTIEAAL